MNCESIEFQMEKFNIFSHYFASRRTASQITQEIPMA
jgi:hypothetical protein